MNLEPWTIASELGSAPAGAGTGVARLLEAAVLAALDAARAPLPAIPVGGHLSVGDRWRAEIRMGGERHAEEAGLDRGHHLLFRLAEFAAKALGAPALPAPAIRAFEDLATRSPAALLTYLAGLGAAGTERKRHWQRAFELDPAMVAPRAGLAEELLNPASAAGHSGPPPRPSAGGEAGCPR
ncbi:MAG: hypothetical protein ACRD1L_13500, partial [Terriglobales bacterium]